MICISFNKERKACQYSLYHAHDMYRMHKVQTNNLHLIILVICISYKNCRSIVHAILTSKCSQYLARDIHKELLKIVMIRNNLKRYMALC